MNTIIKNNLLFICFICFVSIISSCEGTPNINPGQETSIDTTTNNPEESDSRQDLTATSSACAAINDPLDDFSPEDRAFVEGLDSNCVPPTFHEVSKYLKFQNLQTIMI